MFFHSDAIRTLKNAFANKRSYLFAVVAIVSFTAFLILSACIGELFTEKVIYVKTTAPYHVYAERSGEKQNGSRIFRDCEYRLPQNADFWCVSIVGETSATPPDTPIVVYDSQTDTVLADQNDFVRDQYDFRTVKIPCPSTAKRIGDHFRQLPDHYVLVFCTVLFAVFFSMVSAVIFAIGKTNKKYTGALILSGISIFVLNLCLAFAGNPWLISMLTFFTLPFLTAGYWYMLRTPCAAVFFFAILITFTVTRRSEWRDALHGRVADYRNDFVCSLLAMEGEKLAKPVIPMTESTLELRRFIHFYTGGIDHGRWGLPSTIQVKTLFAERELSGTHRRSVMGLRPYLFWTMQHLWKLLGVNWSVFSGFFLFLSFFSIAALAFALYLLGGTWGTLIGGLLIVFCGIDREVMYKTTRNYVVYSAGCFLILSSVVIPALLLKTKRFSCKSFLFHLLFFLFGAEISFWCFWRSDVKSFLLPCIVVPLCVVWNRDAKSVKIRRVICMLLAIAAGFAAMHWLTQNTVARYMFDLTGQFHTAACGEEIRAAATGIEQNNWLYFSDGIQQAYVENVLQKRCPYGTQEYDFECMKMYVKSMAFSGWDYLKAVPQWGYALLKFFFSDFSDFYQSVFAKFCLLALLGCLMCSKNIFSQLGFLLSLLWLSTVLFIVLPMQKHFCTLVPWLAVAVGLGAKNLIAFPFVCTRKRVLMTFVIILGLCVVVALGCAVTRFVASEAHKTVEAQLRQVETQGQKLALPLQRECNAVQLNLAECPPCRLLGIKLHLEHALPDARLYVVLESSKDARKNGKLSGYEGRIQYFYPHGDDFFLVVPIICREKDAGVHLTVFAEKVQIGEEIAVYNADDFTFLPGFSVGLNKDGKIVHGPKTTPVSVIQYRSGFVFAGHCKYKDGTLQLPYHEQICYQSDVEIVK